MNPTKEEIKRAKEYIQREARKPYKERKLDLVSLHIGLGIMGMFGHWDEKGEYIPNISLKPRKVRVYQMGVFGFWDKNGKYMGYEERTQIGYKNNEIIQYVFPKRRVKHGRPS